jgi:hypothetical protein
MTTGPVKISPFPQSTKRYYVYTLAYPTGKIFYVGKGTGDRIHQHEYEAARLGKASSYYYSNAEKHAVIREIWAKGEQVKKEIVFETDLEQMTKASNPLPFQSWPDSIYFNTASMLISPTLPT